MNIESAGMFTADGLDGMPTDTVLEKELRILHIYLKTARCELRHWAWFEQIEDLTARLQSDTLPPAWPYVLPTKLYFLIVPLSPYELMGANYSNYHRY